MSSRRSNTSASTLVFVVYFVLFSFLQNNERFTSSIWVSAFAPSRPARQLTPPLNRHKTMRSSSNTDSDADATTSKPERKLSRPERKAQERARKQKNNKRNGKRKNNNNNNNSKSNNPEAKEYRLHSTAVSKLTSSSTAEDVVKAIKRAQNLHDVHDIRNIERFLLDEVDESFAYGYRGSLLARLAVAAMHMDNNELARKAIEVRRTVHRSSMMPLESAAIIRGLLRMHNITDAVDILDDELSLPLKVSLRRSPRCATILYNPTACGVSMYYTYIIFVSPPYPYAYI